MLRICIRKKGIHCYSPNPFASAIRVSFLLSVPNPQIAEKVGCPVDDTSKMAGCLKITDPRALTLAYKLPLGSTECE